MAEIQVQILTPEKVAFEGSVDSLIAPGEEGLFGILPDHAPMINTLKEGEITLSQSSSSQTIKVSAGFLKVQDNNVKVIVDKTF